MYNYTKFTNKEYDLAHSSGIKSGEIIPDLLFLASDGKIKTISEYTNKPIILETGSLSCGMFAGQSGAMRQLASENKDFNFLLLYVREAHPGNLINAHVSIEQKCNLANRLKTEEKIENRTILIDDIDGTVHKLLGALPNMVLIIDTNRQVIFKNDWNNARSLKKAMQEFRITKKPLVQKWSMLPLPNFSVEYKMFKRTGWDAGLDFIIALQKLIISHLSGGLCSKLPGIC
jgi:Iodothyronine deiodinase